MNSDVLERDSRESSFAPRVKDIAEAEKEFTAGWLDGGSRVPMMSEELLWTVWKRQRVNCEVRKSLSINGIGTG